MSYLVEKTNMSLKQRQIVEAAIEIISEKGFAATSTSEIAKRAGVAEGTIFRHYQSKKDLLLSIVGPVIAEVFAPMAIRDLENVLAEEFTSFESFIRAVYSNRVAFAEKHLPIVRIILQEAPYHPEIRAQILQQVASSVINKVTKIIQHFQLTGEVATLPTKLVFQLIISNLVGFVLSSYIAFPKLAKNMEEDLEQTIQFVVKGLRP